MSNIMIDNKTWKVWLSSNPENPCATLHSLYDLLTDGGILYFQQSHSNKMIGTSLGHDIFIYKNDLYFSNGDINKSKPLSLWEKFGFDLTCPNYDNRNKPLKYPVTFRFDKDQEKTLNFLIYDKSSALLPNSVQEFHNDSKSTFGTAWDSGNNGNEGWNSYKRLFTVGSQDRPESLNKADIILVNKDTVFQSSMIFESGKDSYTRLYLNKTKTISEFIIHCLKKHFDRGNEQYSVIDTIKGNKSDEEFLISLINSENNSISYLLKHIYIWVKAPFAADYIKPEDFDQNLNKDSNVVHKNVYSRNKKGDYNRYDETDIEHEELETKAYIPKNAPLKDYISNQYYSNKSNISETMKSIIEDSDLPESEIGSVLTEPVKENDNKISLTPPQFFDPESRQDESSYNRVPVIIPKYGNIIADSRIMSPTIDEIWYMIKKIISGRPADTDTISGADFAKSFAKTEQDNQPDQINDKDTTINEVNNPFVFLYNGKQKIGDPVNFEIEPSYIETGADKDKKIIINDNAGLKITEFFSQPNKTSYIDYADIVKDIETLQKWIGTNKDYTKIQEINIDGINEFKSIDGENKWGPREAPLSLRELESRILGNKFSIIKNNRYITTNFSVVGPLGYHFEDGDKILTAGSLYQFHRDYNFKHDNPNTFFRINGEGEDLYESGTNNINIKSGLDIEASDLKATNSIPEEDLLLYNSQEKKMSKFPLLVDNYGKSIYLENDYGSYTGADVFLSAIGDWRIKSEHVRLPILRSRY